MSSVCWTGSDDENTHNSTLFLDTFPEMVYHITCVCNIREACCPAQIRVRVRVRARARARIRAFIDLHYTLDLAHSLLLIAVAISSSTHGLMQLLP